ncbi:hypothetical protein IEQ_05118 [Bacillus cereus BAG6X1-2]|nr:hypothetical protein IEQ_05118 [Bacillus cereus BAG6X1-2]
MASKKKVKNIHQSKKKVSTPVPKIDESNLIFDFRYSGWLKSIHTKYFTNKLKNETEFASCIYDVMTKVIPTIQKEWEQIKGRSGQFRHCHPIDSNKIELVTNVIRHIHGVTMLDDDVSNNSIWQLGTHQGIRIIGMYYQPTNTMFPLFVDYHHLIHPSDWHNQKDLDTNSFCPHCHYTGRATTQVG